jgi:two-component system C4-dicarboxylate transport response regulator DctD
MSRAPSVVLVDDDPDIRTGLGQELRFAGFTVTAYENAELAIANQERDAPDVLISDVRLPGMDGVALMRTALQTNPDLPVVLITAHGEINMAVSAMRAGAFDFVEKPFRTSVIVNTTRRASEQRATSASTNPVDSDEIANILVGKSPAMQELRKTVRHFATISADVLITGDTGVGKELVARCLHQFSPRAEQNFVAVNSSALPASTAESELFGHEAGAFTDARAQRIGKFEYADGGSIFLDEIESMPLDLQTEMLRVLQERSISRLGSNKEVALDIRVITAAKVDLKDAVDAGQFREDLLYRLNVLPIFVPPLRQRGNDIYLLFDRFVQKFAGESDVNPPEISTSTRDALIAHSWPGNVRELQNTALRFAITGQLIVGTGTLAADLSQSGLAANLTLADRVAAFEANVVQQTLDNFQGELKPSWEALGISRRTLHEKIARYGLKRN